MKIKNCSNGDGERGVDFSHLPALYWSNTTKASYLQRRIIVYSIMYYERTESCVSDRYYDNISHQLVKLMQDSTRQEMEKTQYWYAMYDFDGSTGFDIPSRLTDADRQYLTNLAIQIHERWRKETGGKIIK